MTFVAYDVCRLCRLLLMTFVGYDVCNIMMFVAYDVFECIAYRVCHSALQTGEQHRVATTLSLTLRLLLHPIHPPHKVSQDLFCVSVFRLSP